MCICRIGEIDPGDLCLITVREKLPVYAFPADDIDIIRMISTEQFHHFFHAAAYRSSFDPVIRVGRKYNIRPPVQRLCSRQTLQRFSSHDNNLAHGFVPEHFLILGNGHQKLAFISDGPVFIYCRNQFHAILRLLFLSQDQFLCVRQGFDPVAEGMPFIQLMVLSGKIDIDQGFVI